MNIDIGPNTTNLLQSLANKLGLTVEKIYPYYIKQSLIEGYSSISIFLAINLILIVFGIVSYFKREKWNERGESDGDFVLGATIVICILMNGIFAPMYPKSISKIMNPEYHVIQMITSDINKMK